MFEDILERQNPWWKTGTMDISLFHRSIEKELLWNLDQKVILGLLGSRRVGKTFLLYRLIQHLLQQGLRPHDIVYLNFDDASLRQRFSTPASLIDFIEPLDKNGKKYLFLDEVQRLENPGLFLKVIFDLELPLKIVVSGSSQLELRSKLKEFLVGRLRQIEIDRLNFEEVRAISPPLPRERLLDEMMIFGGYPAVAQEREEKAKKNLLQDIYATYLEKDISDFAKVEDVNTFHKLLVLLASQIGDLLNIHHLSKALNVSVLTIEKFLVILESTFVVKRILPFFRNQKKELTKMPKLYFLDLGLRNYLLQAWQPIKLRSDRGKLFENFIFLELLARDPYKMKRYRFWRTTNQTEIDFIIEEGLKITGIEVKTKSETIPKSFFSFKKNYPEAELQLMTPENFLKKGMNNFKKLRTQ